MDLVQKIEVGQRYVMSKPGLRYRKKEAKSRGQVAKQVDFNSQKD